MPKGKKACPSCEKSNGCRTKVCECGHQFGKQESTTAVKQTKHPLGQEYVPSLGLWVFHRDKGMPPINVPDELPKGKLDNQAVYDQCVFNGLGYCVGEYIPHKRIADPNLRKAWKKANDAISEVWRYLTDE
jgi:hypothetical protein